MLRTVMTILVLCAVAGCVASVQREVLFKPIYVTRTGTLWLVEKDAEPTRADEVRVVVCHREAMPTCLRVTPHDARHELGTEDYKRWLDSMPPEVRKLATEPDVPPAERGGEPAWVPRPGGG